MKYEALIRKYFDRLDTAWMPTKDLEEYYQQVAPKLNMVAEACAAKGYTDEQVELVIKALIGV
jgi:hypothetical protein